MATKVEQLRGTLGGNMRASMGAGRSHGVHAETAPEPVDRLKGVTRSKEAAHIELDRIARDENQPREEFDPDALARLAESMRTRGQLQPIRVRWDAAREVYVIICGERRWRAAAMAGMTTIACTIHEGEVDVLAVQLIENALREDLKPIEQARAFKALIDRNGWEQQRLAAELSLTKMAVSRCLSLLSLPVEVQERVEQGDLSPSTAYEVTKLADPAAQVTVARAAVDEGLTKAEVVDVIKAVKAKRPTPDRKPEPVALDVGECTVTVRWKRAGATMSAESALREALDAVKRPGA